MILLSEGRGELIHDAAGHPGELVFRALAEQRLFHGIEDVPGHGFEQSGGGYFQSRAAGKAAAQRHGRIQESLEAVDLNSESLKSGYHSTRVVGPAWFAWLQRLSEVKQSRAGESLAAQSSLGLVDRAGGHDRPPLDGHRQNKAVVVVSVFADDVDSSWRYGHPLRRLSKLAGEARSGFLAELVKSHCY